MSPPDPVHPTPGGDAGAGGPPGGPLPPVVAVLGVLLLTAVAVLAATITVLLVPLRVGTTIAPVSVLLAALATGGLPVLARRIADRMLAGLAPIAAWVVTVFVLAQGRPEGDVLLPGSGALALVFYATFGAGVVAGMVSLFRSESVRYPPADRADLVRKR